MQAHFNAGGVRHQRPPTPAMVKRQIRRIGALGLKVNISEMDVRCTKLPANKTIRELAQTQIYRDILAAALSEPAFDGIWLWGFTDRHTWVKNFYYDDSPLIYDEQYRKKASYGAVEAALRTLCPGERERCSFLEYDFDEDGKEWGHEWMMPEPEEEEEAERDTTKEGQPDWVQPTT